MQTRSQTTTVQIDFDEASAAWKANKIPKGNGTYTYRCSAILRSGGPCTQPAQCHKETCKRHNTSVAKK